MSKATIHYHDIGDYLSQTDKLKLVHDFKSFLNLPTIILQPNEHGDWISVRNDVFSEYFNIGDKDGESNVSFFTSIYSRGLATSRDAWVYNSSYIVLIDNIINTLKFYNEQRQEFHSKNNSIKEIANFINRDSTRIVWTDTLIRDASKNIEYKLIREKTTSIYRPFFKQYLYNDKLLIHRTYQMPKLFPSESTHNIVICVQGAGNNKDFSVLISNVIPDLGLIPACQCFPLYHYEENNKAQKGLFETETTEQYTRKDAISDFILERARKQYSAKNISKEDIFYYVYGFLHSPEYRETFANDLKKMLPRLPLVEDVRDFWAFSKAGRQLADLHLNYENVAPYKGVVVLHEPLSISDTLKQANQEELEYIDYHVEKMRFPRKDQKETIVYNSRISINEIPAKAYEYVVNGKSAIEWIMERYQITTHKESGIRNDPNDWAKETGKPRYILDLLLSIINVSVQTVDIVASLPKVKFE